MTYIYLGDRMTDYRLKRGICKAVRRTDGKCIRGRNGSMLVEFIGGTRHIIIGRLLRKRKEQLTPTDLATRQQEEWEETRKQIHLTRGKTLSEKISGKKKPFV